MTNAGGEAKTAAIQNDHIKRASSIVGEKAASVVFDPHLRVSSSSTFGRTVHKSHGVIFNPDGRTDNSAPAMPAFPKKSVLQNLSSHVSGQVRPKAMLRLPFVGSRFSPNHEIVRNKNFSAFTNDRRR